MTATVHLAAVLWAVAGAGGAAPSGAGGAAGKAAPAAPAPATPTSGKPASGAAALPAAPAPAAPTSGKPASGAAAPGKLAPAVSKEMTEAIVAVNKALGLESWPMHGAQPCVDRGGQGIQAKDVTADDARKCAASALEKGFPELGKSYTVAVQMASIGPVTAIAVGLGSSADWGAYSCDPERKCNPVKLSAQSKWGKRTAERKAKSCAESTTLWFPADGNQQACAAAK
jgi:hypothetical protein